MYQSQISTLDAHTRQSQAVTTQWKKKIRGCFLITKTTIYTEDTIDIRRYKETQNGQNTIHWHISVLGVHKIKYQ
jgi:hypothetical protein